MRMPTKNPLQPRFLALVLVIATFAAYEPIRRAGFIWDDEDHVIANPAVAASNGLQMIWSSLAVSRYYPLTLTNFWIQRRLWGLNLRPYHLVNVALHAANGVLIFLLLRRLQVRGAWLASMLWSLHPVNVESVAWITELKNTQSGLFFFLSVLCFLQFDTGGRRYAYVLALICGLAAMLSKPSTVVLPLVLLLCVWWERGSWGRADIRRIAPFFVMALGMSVLTVVEQRGHIQREGTAEWNLGMAERVVIAGRAVWFYTSKILWPVRLTFVYPRWKPDSGSFLGWLPLAGLVVGGVLLWPWRQQHWARAALFGFAFFVAALLPVLGFLDIYYFRYSFVADHFQYLASIGPIALFAAAASSQADSWQLGCDARYALSASLLILLAALTWRQSHIYRNIQILWRDTIAENPQCWMAHYNLGRILEREGKVQEAIEHWEQAVQANPNYVEAHNNLGLAMIQLGRPQEAIGHCEQALRINPNFALAHNNLALALQHTGRVQEAIGHYEQALRIKPDFFEAQNNLALALWRTGRVQEAIEHWGQAVQANPNYVEAHNNLGLAMMQLGRPQEAIGHCEQALRINPNDATAHFNLGLALEKTGRIQEAIQHYQQALRIKPDFVQAQKALARARAVQ
jgi:tetratricopeptide (TPR) repeat protein